MHDKADGNGVPPDVETLLRKAGFGTASGSALLSGMLGVAGDSIDQSEGWPEPQSRRRPRRDDVVTYRVRVDIAGAKPPLWRRLELASDLYLSELHDILQAVFGWQDYHLHRFGSGSAYYGRDTEYYLSPFEVDEGERGVPEEQVRLDEVLVDAGERLFYLYDFGDDWEHVLTLQAVQPRDEDAPRAVCTAGKRPAPPEDCGGVGGYEFVLAATDPHHPHHAEALSDYKDAFDGEPEPERAPVPFDIDAVNTALTAVSRPVPDDLPGPIADLLASARAPEARIVILHLVRRAELDAPAELDADMATEMVRAYSWLLDHVEPDGVQLTGAGYLPPASVVEAAAVLGLSGGLVGKANREVQTLPVFQLRESARRMGLLRKYKGKVLPTSTARKMSGDPGALWHHLADHMPLTSKDTAEQVGGVLMLLAVAARSDDVFSEVAEAMTELGWRVGGGEPLTRADAVGLTRDSVSVLDALGGWTRRDWRRDEPTPQGAEFARAALLRG